MAICYLFIILFITAALSAQVYGKAFPNKIIGMYLLIADDGEPGYTSTDNWKPSLYPFLMNGSNVFWTAFINPTNMTVPPAMINLAKCRDEPGCPTSDQFVIFSIGGASYSEYPSKWPFLMSSDAAISMAQQVATWSTKYGCDGIDLDIETGAGDDVTQSNNLLIFAQNLKKLNPGFIITQPVYDYPGVRAETLMVNNGWTSDGTATGLIASIGIMEYNNEKSLQDVKNYANATNTDDGVTVNVPTKYIQVGLQGGASASTIIDMANKTVSMQLNGLMIWYSSVYDKTRNKDAFYYSKKNNAYPNSYSAWAQALKIMQQ